MLYTYNIIYIFIHSYTILFFKINLRLFGPLYLWNCIFVTVGYGRYCRFLELLFPHVGHGFVPNNPGDYPTKSKKRWTVLDQWPQHYLMIATKHYTCTPWSADINSIIGFILLMYQLYYTLQLYTNIYIIYIEF